MESITLSQWFGRDRFCVFWYWCILYIRFFVVVDDDHDDDDDGNGDDDDDGDDGVDVNWWSTFWRPRVPLVQMMWNNGLESKNRRLHEYILMGGTEMENLLQFFSICLIIVVQLHAFVPVFYYFQFLKLKPFTARFGSFSLLFFCISFRRFASDKILNKKKEFLPYTLFHRPHGSLLIIFLFFRSVFFFSLLGMCVCVCVLLFNFIAMTCGISSKARQ